MLNSFAVGGGTSGSVLATRLSEEPDSVLLIEAGRSDLANDNIPIPAYYGNTQLSKDDWTIGFWSCSDSVVYFLFVLLYNII
jgi:choline dehydrogenase-like flavoprotein